MRSDVTASREDSGRGRLAGKVALVTGIETETGLAIGERFGAEGATVVGCVGSGQRAATQAEPPVPMAMLDGNISVAADAERIVAWIMSEHLRLDVLVNYGAARRVVGSILDITDAEFDEEMRADLKSVIVLSRAVIPAMARGDGGAIINISSIARAGVRGRALRSASKAALATLTCSMALDHGEQGIRVNALLLGPTLTSDMRARQEQVSQLESETPLGQLHTPEDVAAAALFFASDDAARITGALLPLDAGRSLPHF